jgi:hypothetical protein
MAPAIPFRRLSIVVIVDSVGDRCFVLPSNPAMFEEQHRMLIGIDSSFSYRAKFIHPPAGGICSSFS